MTQVRQNKSLPTDQIDKRQTERKDALLESKIHYQQQNQSDSEAQQNLTFVEAILGPQKTHHPAANQREIYQEEDQDIKRFLEEQTPGIYSKKQEQGTHYQEEQDNFYSYYNSSIAPEYFGMSRFQKQKFFDNLNALYMARLDNQKMGVQKSRRGCGPNVNSEIQFPIKKRKRAIRFNEILYQVPFNKQDQPMAVKGTRQEQADVRFDNAAQEYPSSSQRQDEVQINEQCKYLNQTSNYFGDMESSDYEDDFGTQIQSRLCRERLQVHERQYQIFTESAQASQSSDQNLIRNSNCKIMSEGQKVPNKFKRNSNRQFLSQSDESQQESLAQINEDSEDQFIDCLNGRKIISHSFNFVTQTNATQLPIDSLESDIQSQP